MKDPNLRQSAPAAERNKYAILGVLKGTFPARGLVLEIASGTGQHVAHFAGALPALVWQPSDPDPAMRNSICGWMAFVGRSNIRPPLDLDVQKPDWPIRHADAIFCANMIHIAPWAATEGLFAGAAAVLGRSGKVVLYGPFKRFGEHTAPSNAAFDASIRQRDPSWGVRDVEAVEEVADQHGFVLSEIVPMPANNCCVIFISGASSLTGRHK